MCSDSLYNFSGILYRMGIVCGVLVLLGIVCILLERMPAKKWKKRADKMGWIMIAGSILLALFYASSIVFPDVSAYTGEFVGRHGNGKGFMIKEYVFWTGEGTKKERRRFCPWISFRSRKYIRRSLWKGRSTAFTLMNAQG